MKRQRITISLLLFIATGLLAGCVFTISLSPNMHIEIDHSRSIPVMTSTPVQVTPAPIEPEPQPELPNDYLGIDLMPAKQTVPLYTTFYSISVAAPRAGGYANLADSLLITDVEPSLDQFTLAIAHVYSGSIQSAFTNTQSIQWLLFLNSDEKARWGTDSEWETTTHWLRLAHLNFNDSANLITTQSIAMSETQFLQPDSLFDGVGKLETALADWMTQHPGLELWVDFVIIQQTKGKRLYSFYFDPNDPSGGSSVRCRQWFSCDTAQGGWQNFCKYVLRCD